MLLQGGQVWLKDKDASHCKLCEKEFSISRRKVSDQINTTLQSFKKSSTWLKLGLCICFWGVSSYPFYIDFTFYLICFYLCLCLQHHCRNCGEIFCNSCSDNELPLPASPKPVRVCDTCHALLLQRCSSNPTWRSPTLLLQTIWHQTPKYPAPQNLSWQCLLLKMDHMHEHSVLLIYLLYS